MNFSEKIKTIDNKIQLHKGQYNLDRQSAKISALLSGNAGKYGFLAGEDILPEREQLEKVANIKRFTIIHHWVVNQKSKLALQKVDD